MTEETITTFDEILDSGELSGYQDYYNSIDADVAENETTCERCGGKQKYHGMKDYQRNSYRAFAECINCHNVVEF